MFAAYIEESNFGTDEVYVDGELVWEDRSQTEHKRRWDGAPSDVARAATRRTRFHCSLEVFNEWRKMKPGSEARRALGRLMRSMESGRVGLEYDRVVESEKFMMWGEVEYGIDRKDSLESDPAWLTLTHEVFVSPYHCEEFLNYVAPCGMKSKRERPDLEPGFFRKFGHLYERFLMSGKNIRDCCLFDHSNLEDPDFIRVGVLENGFLYLVDKPVEEDYGGSLTDYESWSCAIL